MKIRITAVGMVLIWSGLALASCTDATTPRTGPPVAPTDLVATATSASQIALEWQDNSTNEEVFAVERCTGVGCTTFVQIATLPPNTTSYQDQDLAGGKGYSYRVRACIESTGEYSSYSNTATDTTNVTPPAAPTNLVATATPESQIVLTWQDNSGNEDSFALERCSGTGCMGFALLARVGPNRTSYQDQDLTEGTSYSYRVQASAVGFHSRYSNTATAMASTGQPTRPPHAP